MLPSPRESFDDDILGMVEFWEDERWMVRMMRVGSWKMGCLNRLEIKEIKQPDSPKERIPEWKEVTN